MIYDYFIRLLEWCKINVLLIENKQNIYFKEGVVWWCSVGLNIGEEEFGKGPTFGYKKSQLTEAEARYLQSESSANSANTESVLVSVDSVNALRRAYPNYFLDTKKFVDLVTKVIK